MTPSFRLFAVRRVGAVLAGALLLAACKSEPAAGDTHSSSTQPSDDDIDAGDTAADAGTPIMKPDAASSGCGTAADCDDQVFCNGVERCVDGQCAAAPSEPCILRSMCLESARRCDCDFDRDGLVSARCGGPDCDEDGDKHEAFECGGDDCDDTDRLRYSGNAEVCDPEGLDEDCNPTTVAGPSREEDPIHYDRGRDHDDDGALSKECCNLDPTTGEIHYDSVAVYDCDDAHATVGPKVPEICDDVDNDCDGVVDEVQGSGVALSQQQEYCYDEDGDGWGRRDRKAPFCTLPAHYAPCRFDDAHGEDCNDQNKNVYPGNKVLEVCDGEDNDCDGKIDQADLDVRPLPDELSSLGTGTELACLGGRDGHWEITACPEGREWCDRSTVVHGCETNVRRLSTCRSCEPTACQFSCGDKGCDEIRTVSVGYEHACAVTTEGRVACWGRGFEGRLGNDGIVSSSVPVQVIGLTGALEVAAGYQHTCAVVGDEGAAYCWGSNGSNQLGSADGSNYNATPVAVVGVVHAVGQNSDRMLDIVHVAVGTEHSCAVAKNGEVYCWGEISSGRLGDHQTASGPGSPRRVQRLDPSRPGGSSYAYVTDATEVHAGDEHTCLLTIAGGLECWGDNTFGQIGDPSVLQEPFIDHAHPVPGILKPTQLAMGAFHTCVLATGKVFCWGLNDHLQLGRASDEHDGEPLPVPGLDAVTSIAAGSSFTCATTAAGATLCWGDGGRLGATDEDTGPQAVAVNHARLLAAGGFACALSSDEQRPRCWGEDFYGQLGIGSTSLDPIEVSEPIRALLGSE